VRIVLELDPAADPIGGRLSAGGAPAQAFSGWLALGRALEQELAHARADAAQAALIPPTPAPDRQEPALND
jgi:hypothetical protein